MAKIINGMEKKSKEKLKKESVPAVDLKKSEIPNVSPPASSI